MSCCVRRTGRYRLKISSSTPRPSPAPPASQGTLPLYNINQWRIQVFQRGANSPCAATYYLATKFCRKLHENEENRTDGVGGTRPKFYYADPPLDHH